MKLKSRIFILLFIPMMFSGIGLIHLISLIFPSANISSDMQLIMGLIVGIFLWVVDSIALYKMVTGAQSGRSKR